MGNIEVRLTVKCVVANADEAYEALKNAAEGCERAGWETVHGELRAVRASEEGE